MVEADDERRDARRGAPQGNTRGGLANRLARRDGGRPRSVYAVLVAGVAALLALLLVIYFSSDRDTPEQPICTTVDASTARQAVLEGRITRITMAYDDIVTPPSASTWGPVLARLDYTDGQCANLPQGIVSQNDIYLITGTIKVFNDITENQQIEIRYDRQTALDPALFWTPTPTPTATPEVTPTATASPTAEATATPTVSPTPTPTRAALIPPVGSPVASPAAATPDLAD